MRATGAIVMLIVLAGLATGPAAFAEPRNGFGLAGGVVGNAGQRTFPNGVTVHSTSAGFSIAGDAQFTVNERWSLNPYLQLSWERSSGDLEGTASNGGAGIEMRRWFGDLFLGARLGYFVELLSTETNTGTGYGPGGGVSIGHESLGALTWAAVVDLARVGVYGDHVSLRLHVGRRWD